MSRREVRKDAAGTRAIAREMDGDERLAAPFAAFGLDSGSGR
jgi:hypothetical protein